MPRLLRVSMAWCALLLLAILNGALRELVLVSRLGAPAAHVASTLLLAVLILGAAWLLGPWIGYPDRASALQVGLTWAVLTLLFEFIGGHYLFGRTWEVALADYDVREGRIWPLVPIVTLFAPWVTRRTP